MFVVKRHYHFNESGMVLDYLWTRGCTTLNPNSVADPKITDDFENEHVCYHGPPNAQIIKAYEFLFSRYKMSQSQVVEDLERKRVEYNNADFGLYSKKICYEFLLDPDSDDFKNGVNFSTCPCSRICHFGMNTHSWYYDVNLPLYPSIVVGNVLKNAKLSSPHDIKSVKKRPYFEYVRKSYKVQDALNISQVIPHENVLVRYLIDEGFISKEANSNKVCEPGPLNKCLREQARRTGWESVDSESDSDNEDCNSDDSNMRYS